MRTLIVCFLTLLLVCSVPFGAIAASSGPASSAEPPALCLPAYTPHGAIVIAGNQDFVDQGWAGEGSASDPYMISGLEIVVSGFGITVTDTTSHFVISDCNFSSSSDWNEGGGVQFENVENGRVERCRAYSINSGVDMKQCVGCSVTDSCFEKVHIPLSLYMCPQCQLSDNIIQGTVFLYDCDNCSVQSNVQTSIPGEELTIGFNMIWCDSCCLVNNTVTANTFGIWASCCLDLFLQNNELVENGIFLDGSEDEHFVIQSSDNQVNGKPLGYFTGTSGVTIDGREYGQVVVTASGNITVTHGNFDNASVGLLLAGTQDCLINNVSAYHSYYGILVEESHDCIIADCTLNENYFGVSLSDLSACIRIANNTVRRNSQTGIHMASALECNVTGNAICENGEYGLWVGGNGHFIYWNIICGNGENAADDGEQNAWDDGESCGNFWDDMTPGAVYVISGSAGSVDHYPNGTVGTYTVTSTGNSSWIGNSTTVVIPPEILMPLAAAVCLVMIMTAVVVRRRGGV